MSEAPRSILRSAPVGGTVDIPGSKSVSNRALLIAALAFILSLLEWWLPFAYVEDMGDPKDGFINLRGVVSRIWPLWMAGGVLMASSVPFLWYSSRGRRLLGGIKCPLALLVLAIVIAAAS